MTKTDWCKQADNACFVEHEVCKMTGCVRITSPEQVKGNGTCLTCVQGGWDSYVWTYTRVREHYQSQEKGARLPVACQIRSFSLWSILISPAQHVTGAAPSSNCLFNASPSPERWQLGWPNALSHLYSELVKVKWHPPTTVPHDSQSTTPDNFCQFSSFPNNQRVFCSSFLHLSHVKCKHTNLSLQRHPLP